MDRKIEKPLKDDGRTVFLSLNRTYVSYMLMMPDGFLKENLLL